MLRSAGSEVQASIIVVHRLSCSMVYGIFLDWGSNRAPCTGRQTTTGPPQTSRARVLDDIFFVPVPSTIPTLAYPQQVGSGDFLSTYSTLRQSRGISGADWGGHSRGFRPSELTVAFSASPHLRRGLHPRYRDPHGARGGDGQALRRQGGRLEQLLYDAAHAQRLPPLDPILPRTALPQGP